MHADEVMLAEAMKPAGYVSGCFGKWHNGANQPSTADRGIENRGSAAADDSEKWWTALPRDAWAAFEAAKWGGEQSIQFSVAGASRTESTRYDTRAGSSPRSM